MHHNWIQKYHSSFNEVINNIPHIKGIALGLNTNVDTIIYASPEIIESLLEICQLTSQKLDEKIMLWKGVVENLEDFVVGICGCFREGKASEWIITNETIYQQLIDLLPVYLNHQLGGQAGIMANVLAAQNVPQIFVHTASFPQELKNLFIKCNNIKFPVLNENREVYFCTSKDYPTKEEKLYLHIISELKKGDCIKIDNKIEWKCPRNNRFIATYDPLNAKMVITPAFELGISTIALESDGMIFAGFHMLNYSTPLELTSKIQTLHSFLKNMKKINPELFLQLELSSTKNKQILEKIISISKSDNLWDSLSCNERELAEVLEVLRRKDLATKIKRNNDSNSIIEGCKIVFKELKLKRFHIHLFGCYILITDNQNPLSDNQLENSLFYAAIITAYRAKYGSFNNLNEINEKLNQLLNDFIVSPQFMDMDRILQNLEHQNDGNINTISNLKPRIIVIPTILIENPRQTVGLGDTISASAFVAELALKKKK